MPDKPPFLQGNPAASGGDGYQDRSTPQRSGAPNFNADTVCPDGRIPIPRSTVKNPSPQKKPYKGLSDGEGEGEDLGDAADLD